MTQSLVVLRWWNGRAVSRFGTDASLSMARTILPGLGFLHEPGVKSSATSARLFCSRFCGTKMLRRLFRSSHQSRQSFSSRKFVASAPCPRMSLHEYSLPLLHHSPTPLSHPLPKLSPLRSERASEFLSPAHSILPANRLQFCGAIRPRLKSAPNDRSRAASEFPPGSARVSRVGFGVSPK